MINLLKPPFSTVKTIHFIGIGGIGMSGIAEIFFNLGFNVQGSDLKSSDNITRLQSLGIKVFQGHKPENINGADVIAISSAINENNSEYKHALDLGLPIFKRAKILAELMRFKWSIAVAGTHGKTTTTSLVSHIMHYNNMDPTSIIGGIVNLWGHNSHLGNGNWLVAESDESDGSFLDLPATISVITNIESEHLDHYKDYNDIKEHFIRFVNNIPFYGFSVVCLDNSGVQDILPCLKQRKIITYGISPQSDYQINNIVHKPNGVNFNINCNLSSKQHNTVNIDLPMYGDHNVLNATAAFVVAINIGISPTTIRESLLTFQGVKRRFTNIGSYKQANFIDDYAHHPTEVEAVIDAANSITNAKGKIITIFQPHRYSRLKSNFEGFSKCFNESEYVIVLDVYSAGEDKIEGYSASALVQAIKKYGHKNVQYVPNSNFLYEQIKGICNKEDIGMVIFMGAGDITKIAKDTLYEINKYEK